MRLKKIFFVLFAFVIFVSCSSNNDLDYHYELLAVENASVPEEFEFGRTYEISIDYIRPDDCYIYSDVLYEYDFDARNVAVISTVVDGSCEPLNSDEVLTFRVQALQHSPYIFKFWQGENENGDPIYLIIEVPVI